MVELYQMNRRSLFMGALALISSSSIVTARNVSWAKPITLAGVPNLNLVAPNLYRSAQPTADGFQAARKRLHLNSVLNLRESSTDTALLVGMQLESRSVPMNAMHITQGEVIEALKIITAAKAKGPVLVHCLHGADRTGVVMAMYRILYQGWSKEQAIDEMKNGGYNFHSIFVNIPNFIQNADIAAFKRELAIQP
jgi:protein tyrosine/serine phosphatase